MVKRIRHIALVLLMLLFGGMVNEAWAYKVTYHVLTLPIDNNIYHLADDFSGKRLEAVMVVDNSATIVDLPAAFKSPLVTPGSFKYYASTDVTKSATAVVMYAYSGNNKSYHYTIKDGATDIAGTTVSSNIEVYVTYEYNADNTIYKLDGSKKYNLSMSGGYLALNRGRNNRIAVIPESANRVSAEDLASDDFVKLDVSGISGTNISNYWNGNPNPKDQVAGQFYFKFKFMGSDPYNILICTAYDKDYTYIEKHGSESQTCYKYYKNSYLYWPASDNSGFFLSSDDHTRYTQVSTGYDPNPKASVTSEVMTGYFKSKGGDLTYNSFALLNNTGSNGYVFMISRYIDKTGTISTPGDYRTAQYRFLTHDTNWNNLKSESKTLANVSENYSTDDETYPVYNYVFKVKTPFENFISVDKDWSDAYLSQSLMEHFPDELRRKYVTIEGLYSDQAFTDPVTTFADAKSRCTPDGAGKYSIYVKYSVQESLPFTAIAADNKTSGYSTATWYELTDAGSVQADGKKIRWDNTNSVFKNNGESGTYEKESEFAFIGDPYELRIICRKQTTENSANYYVGCADPSSSENLGVNSSDESAHYKWEIPYDDTSGSFTLREMNSSNACWYWDASSAGNSLTYSTTASTRIKPMTIGKLNYTFKVVDLAGNIAIQATAEASPFTPLTGAGVGYSMIPASIRSPYIADETITFHSTYSSKGRGNLSGQLTELPGVNNSDIYVAYTTSRLSNKSITLGEGQSFNVKLNDEYIYWDSSTGKILSNANPGINPVTEKSYLEDYQYLWRLRGRDPYAMIIDNIGATVDKYGGFTENETVTIYADDGTPSTQSRYKGAWVKTSDGSWGDGKSLVFDGDRANAARFIAMMGSYAGVYEVMAATGDDTYYHIGRASEENAEVKIYSTSAYAHGADELRFILESTTLIQYHLIDKSGKEIFRDEISSKNARLALPTDYVSPLVASYHYYAASDVNRANGADGNTGTEDDIFTPVASPTDLSEAGDNTEIYVFYDVDDEIGFGDKHPHLLKFLDPHEGGYYLEDGLDKLTTTPIEAIYPYCNGDGSLNIYGQIMRDEQMDGGSSTRPRWVWYFESDHNDPYHVKIHSKSTISFGGRNNTTYLQTFAVHFNQDTDAPNKQHIVTGGNLIGITQDKATEYAILGIKNKYKLLTIDRLKADLNGNGNTNDDGENERRSVTSFEQYWKTYNMIRLDVLGLEKATEDGFSDDPSTFVVPDDKRAELMTKQPDWHSYDVVANATRWNGFNDVEGKSGLEKKKVERLEHWFQTFDMGNGTFDIEDADIPAVLVLLDRHGWEIMRKPIPVGNGDSDPSAGEKLAALRAYDSPMVKEYTFYSNATKASNCHKYSIRLDGKGLERDTIPQDGKRFTSTSLAILPNYKADRDLFVTYTVKEEYEKSYTPSTSTASKFIILQNHQYAKDDNSALTPVGAPSNLSNEIIADAGKEENLKTFKQECLWYIQPNSKIDDEMGYPWETITTYTDKENGFDPYNVQFKNVSTEKFFTIHMTRSVLNKENGGTYIGVYSGEGGSLDVTLAAECTSPVSSPESYDHSTLMMTNQTFMAVQDANGNMQLMPRFDHTRRVNALVSLASPLTNATKADVDDATPGAQTTFFVRPQVFDYRIIDNDGNVAMHYQTAGEAYPSMPEHFKSPLAKDFKFYKGLTQTAGVYDMSDIESKEITSSFAAAGIQNNANIFIRYSYDEANDIDYDNILRGRWMTISLGGKDTKASGTVVAANNETSGTGVSFYTGTKDASQPEWQWKFLGSPSVATLSNGESNPYYTAPDPYAVKIYNRSANYDTNPTANPNKMGTAIKVVGTDRFIILNHPSGDYALAAAGDGLTYSFLNGSSMTEPSATAASIVLEGDFTTTSNTITDGARLIFTNDVTHNFTYKVITNDKLLAAFATQNDEEANENGYNPVVPEGIQSQLIYLDDYLYYGTATYTDKGTEGVTPDDEYTHDVNSQIDNLYGLYDDVVYVRYPAFSRDNTPYLVPNARNDASPVAVGAGSNDVAIDISGNLPYDIIWLEDNMMRSTDGTNIIDGGDNEDHTLSAKSQDMWHFEGDDPYAIKIRRDGTNPAKYVDGTKTLNETPKTFMLLKREGYDYGVFAETGNQGTMLTFGNHDSNDETPYTLFTTTEAPTKFIPFALSVYHLIYHLVIAKTCPDQENPQSGEYVDIPYRDGDETTYQTIGTFDADNDKKTIYGSTQRDLTSKNDGDGDHVAGEKYQLGETINGQTYSHDAGKVSLGDELDVPACFYRPNVLYSYYVEGVYDNLECTTPNNDLNNKYKGLKVTKLMSDADLIGKTVRVNITYGFLTGLETNSGGDFVTSVSQNKWYTFEAKASTPKLAQYTGSLQTVSGYATHYTNDYLWTPLGDPYGFKMHNRYMYKNLGEGSTVMTTSSAPGESVNIEMRSDNTDNSVYELLAEESTSAGYFLVHPVVNNTGTQYYMRDDNGTLKLSATPTEWTYGLSEDVMRPYFEGAGNVGGLNDAGKAAYEAAAAETDPKKMLERLMNLQNIVYNHDNDDSNPENPNYIVHYAPGYYRLHNQPGSEGISPLRYASGYLHDMEKTAGAESTAIPMHFYSRVGVSTTFEGEEAVNLNTGFTKTNATQGAIPVPSTEYDPSTIFYFTGASASSVNISTQGLNVLGNKMTTGDGTTFTITDIGGAIVALSGAGSNYLRYDQSDADHIYDLTYDAVGNESARWCMEPAGKQGLMIATNDGGDGYFYSTFCAPFDVQLPKDAGSNSYYAYVCTEWNSQSIHPAKVPANNTISDDSEGKFVPAGTPVIIRTTNNTGSIKLTLPKNSPTSALTCVFTGKYLEQLLSETISSSGRVYTFGLPITGYNIIEDGSASDGEITNLVARDQAKKGVGFYVNATPNKELGANNGAWTPNNRYVLHNKIYYRSGSSGSSAPAVTRGVDFVPVIFDDEEPGEEELQPDGSVQVVGDGCIYDLMGRKVATKEQVEDGTCRERLAPGIYIINGKKFKK